MRDDASDRLTSTKARRRWGLCLAALLVLTAPSVRAGDDEVLPHADEVVEAALEKFEARYDTDDMDAKLNILRWLGMHWHDDVIKVLKKIYLKEDDLELKAAAAEGLGNQAHDPKAAAKILLNGLKKYRKLAGKEVSNEEEEMQELLESKLIVAATKALGKLEYRKAWDEIEKLIDHNSDAVAIAAIEVAGAWKEYKALPIILQWFHHYPDGASWSGGSVRVDTGAAGNRDARAARAKYQSLYGGRAKKARPKAFEAMVKAVKEITGVEMTKQEELKAWMEENAAMLKRHGV